ncbi:MULTISPECIES: helix-turn-helix domain-containing protein [Serratia]|uniref:XRE family transcriptional regulator n=1 Tax=Serratia marcescens TaxID=615 RepID=A0ABD6HM61_SERMA|nr:XRE family transcriptional regulator [Serratia marcescens]MVF02890.1 XRE family transcriptional regulator [Serratia marcescens]
MTDKIDTASRHVTQPDDNIFIDLGFPAEQAAALLAKSDEDIAQAIEMKRQLMTEISGWIKVKGYKQITAAKILHVSRPRVSDVVNLKTEKFTLDSLVGMMALTGKKVRMVID